jgi:AcrR family transcriptional regulator
MVEDGRRARQNEGKVLILDGAKRRYSRGERIEITTLAAECGISRSAAYRWFGDNENLLAEVLAEWIREHFNGPLLESADKSGRERVLVVLHGFLRDVAESDSLTALLTHEPRRALKVLVSSTHHVQRTTIELVGDLLAEEGTHDLAGGVPLRERAYAVVRLLEAFLYIDAAAGQERDVDAAVRLIALIISPGT